MQEEEPQGTAEEAPDDKSKTDHLSTTESSSATTTLNKEPDAKPDEEEEDGGGVGDEDEDDRKTGSSSASAANDGLPRGLVTWREAVRGAQNAAQLAMAFYILETSIAWDKSIMKASCQFCYGGENENALLLCDSCDRGYHTYCFKPPITTIPEGDW